MYIFGKRIDQIDESDINRLINNGVPESKTLDYKKELNITLADDKKEFLFDITAMYNTDGGTLIYGIGEGKDENGKNTGVPSEIYGIEFDNQDKLIQRIEDIIISNTEPSISTTYIKVFEVDNKNILVLGISKGLGLPSMVTFNGTNKFYKRKNSGKYPVDVYELNHMFMQNQYFVESAENFRLKRIEKVRNLKVYPTLETSTSFFIHIIPFSFLDNLLIDLSKAGEMNMYQEMLPMYATSANFMYNLDGFYTYAVGSNDTRVLAFDQLFRNGVFETYTSLLFNDRKYDGKEIKLMYGVGFIKDTVNKIEKGLSVLKKFNLEGPFIICISLHGVSNGTIEGDRRVNRLFMNDEIVLPPVVIPAYDAPLYKNLKPLFDIIWQAAGASNSPRIE